MDSIFSRMHAMEVALAQMASVSEHKIRQTMKARIADEIKTKLAEEVERQGGNYELATHKLLESFCVETPMASSPQPIYRLAPKGSPVPLPIERSGTEVPLPHGVEEVSASMRLKALKEEQKAEREAEKAMKAVIAAEKKAKLAEERAAKAAIRDAEKERKAAEKLEKELAKAKLAADKKAEKEAREAAAMEKARASLKAKEALKTPSIRDQAISTLELLPVVKPAALEAVEPRFEIREKSASAARTPKREEGIPKVDGAPMLEKSEREESVEGFTRCGEIYFSNDTAMVDDIVSRIVVQEIKGRKVITHTVQQTKFEKLLAPCKDCKALVSMGSTGRCGACFLAKFGNEMTAEIAESGICDLGTAAYIKHVQIGGKVMAME